MEQIWFALLFFLPAGLANGAPVIANKVPLLNRFHTPMDFGVKWRGKRIFGDHKTWRGLFSGTVTGAVTAAILYGVIFNNADAISLARAALSGGFMGFGALLGDAVESSIKRWRGVPSGETWFPFDQIDYIVGGLLFSAVSIHLSLQQYVVIFAVWFGMHLIFAYLFYLLGFKDKPI